VVETGSDDSLSADDESTKKRRDILTRRPSYRKILNDLGGGEIAGMYLPRNKTAVHIYSSKPMSLKVMILQKKIKFNSNSR
jgi:hypothetical protein